MRVTSLFLVVITVSLLGCQKVQPRSSSPQSSESPKVATQEKIEVAKPAPSTALLLTAQTGQLSGGDLETFRSHVKTEGEDFHNFEVAEFKKTYSASELQGLFPKKAVKLAETWPIEKGVASLLLSQFNSRVTEEMNMDGSGAYGLLKAYSDTHILLELRVHAQFEVTPQAWLSPAYFKGEVLLERESGAIDYFRLAVPTKHVKNVAYEIHRGDWVTGLLFIPVMELSNGMDEKNLNKDWLASVDDETAERTLAQALFPFKKVDWYPPDQAWGIAQKEKKPMLAVVIEGVLDDQSC